MKTHQQLLHDTLNAIKDKKQLARTMKELLEQDSDLRAAVRNIVWSCTILT